MDVDEDLLFPEWEDDSLLLIGDFDNATSSFQSSIGTQNGISSKGEAFLQQIDEDLDYAFALSLQTQYEEEVKENINCDSIKSSTKGSQLSKPLSIIDEQWELIDPHPDIHVLFQEYDNKFFYGKLKHVEVKWSPRMTLCAGVCSYEGRGGLCSIRLSVPLLKLRPRKDLVETLLHEMIHAYLFVTHNNKDRDGHGPQFLSHMNRINKESGTRITVYHSFHDEVDLYRQHWWKCNGPCKNRRPYYGVLKRAMNRPPGPTDNWWTDHQANCGGTFVKIKEPDNYGKKKPTQKKAISELEKSPDIRRFLKDDLSQNGISGSTAPTAKSNVYKKNSHSGSTLATINNISKKDDKVQSLSNVSPLNSSLVSGSNIATIDSENVSPKKTFIPFQGVAHKLGGSDGLNKVPSLLKGKNYNKTASSNTSKRPIDVTSLSDIHKTPRLSNSQKKLHKDQKPCTSTVTNVTSAWVQSPIEKFLSSKNANSTSSSVKRESCVTKSSVQESSITKVACPVCFVLVEEQGINSHLDTCLTN